MPSQKVKRATGSFRSKAGLPAKAGRRRPHALISVRDKNGKREWQASNNPSMKKVSKAGFGINEKVYHDIYDRFDQNEREVISNKLAFKDPKNKGRVEKIRRKLGEMAKNIHKSDPFWFGQKWKDFKMGYISMQQIEKGFV